MSAPFKVTASLSAAHFQPSIAVLQITLKTTDFTFQCLANQAQLYAIPVAGQLVLYAHNIYVILSGLFHNKKVVYLLSLKKEVQRLD